MKYAIVVLSVILFATGAAFSGPGAKIVEASGVKGGLVVHLGCGDGKLTAGLRVNDSYIVQGLDAGRSNVDKAREYILGLGVYGKVSIDRLNDKALPFTDNLVNLVVSDDLGGISMTEVMRVLAPGGVAIIKGKKTVKPRPDEIDEWTHYMHDAGGNAVADDTVVGPPRHLQWVGGPRYSRHHDNMSSVSAVVSAAGRVFYIIDEAPPFSILIAPQWKLVARDAFNGTILWKRSIVKWYDHLHPLKNGPSELPRRLVAEGDRVYVTLGLNAAVTSLDAATGRTVKTYKDTESTQEILFSGGVLFVRIGGMGQAGDTIDKIRNDRDGFADESTDKILAIDADSGKTLWNKSHNIVKLSLAADDRRVIFLSGENIVSLDRSTGKMLWRSELVARADKYLVRSGPTVVLYDDIILLAGSELAAAGNRSWDVDKDDTLTALSAETGKILWTALHPNSGYASPEDVLVINDTVWYGDTTSGHAVGTITGRNIHTGKVVTQFDPDVETYWFHHRCHRGKATVNYLMTSRTGIEYIDIEKQSWDINHWIRGACLYGVMPANGLTYAPQHPCACFPEAKLSGFSATAAKRDSQPDGVKISPKQRLEKGPAYNKISNIKYKISNRKDWPVYRHDNARSGSATTSVPTSLTSKWKAKIGGKITSPVVAGGRVFVAAVDTHTVYALKETSGKKLWNFMAGARIDSPPTVYKGMVLFGSADGYVYNLRADDGELVWRFRAAPIDRRLMSFEQIESVWPVHGSVLVHDGVLFFVAGRSAFLDGGMILYRLDPATGRLLSSTILDEIDREANVKIQDYARQHNMPVSLPDILSCDGRLVYMRSQPFDLSGKRLPLEALPYAGNPEKYSIPPTQTPELAHLFSPTGFVDDSWWHRTYWVYGSRFTGGWAGYSKAGKETPSGKILVFDEQNVYGFGRKPQYYRWSTPIEHHLFSAAKDPSTVDRRQETPQKGKKTRASDSYKVAHHWTSDLPLLARALVLADGTLFLAGPEDMVDEQAIGKNIEAPGVPEKLQKQLGAYQGKYGAELWAVSASTGEKLSGLEIGSVPVFDGLIAANRHLFLTDAEGNLTCFGER